MKLKVTLFVLRGVAPQHFSMLAEMRAGHVTLNGPNHARKLSRFMNRFKDNLSRAEFINLYIELAKQLKENLNEHTNTAS